MNDPKIAYLGPSHTYSHLAALCLQPAANGLMPCATIDEVFAAIETGTADHGVVPFYNSTCGLVSDTIVSILRRLRSGNNPRDQQENSGHPNSLAPQAQLCISQSFGLEIEHCLVSWGDLQSIRQVASKQQALDQCRSWLKVNLPAAQWVPLDSSTLAMADLANRCDLAAIVSRPAAATLNAPLILHSIQDESDNRTEFVLVQLDSQAKCRHRTIRPNQSSCSALQPLTLTLAGEKSAGEKSADEKSNSEFQYWVVERDKADRSEDGQLSSGDLLKLTGIEFPQIVWQANIEYVGRLYLVAKVGGSSRLNSTELWTEEIILPQPAGTCSVDAAETTIRRAWRLGADPTYSHTDPPPDSKTT